MTFRLAFALGLCAFALAVEGSTAASHSASRAPLPPRFRPGSGWIVVSPGHVSTSMVVAVTARDAALLQPFAPFVGFKRLSARGIIVWALTLGRDRPGFSPLRWPPVLSTFRVDRGWEGQPASNIQQRLGVGSVHGWDLDLRVFFATQHPDGKLLEQAQAQLRRLLLPSR